MTTDIRRLLDQATMSRAQVIAVGLTTALSALDGYDVLSITFAAPAISQSWHVGKADLGAVLASGLVGMALGSLLLAPLADLVGRRRMILTALLLMMAGMLLSAVAPSLGILALLRVLTGLGIGAMVGLIIPLAGEFANAHRRAQAMSVMCIGYPLGGVIGGVVAAILLRNFSWHAVFVGGAVAAGMLFPLVLLFLPESPAFLLSRRSPDALDAVNRLLIRFGHAPVDALPPVQARGKASYAAIFAPGMLATTLQLTLINLLLAMAVYFVLSWMPQMIADAGFTASTASLITAVANVGGIAGALILGWLATHFAMRRLAVIALLGMGIATMIFGATPASLPLLLIAAGACGLFLNSSITAIYTTLNTSFAAEARASGSGFVVGIGRIGSAVAPYIAGRMFALGFDRAGVSMLFGAFAVLAGAIYLYRRRVAAPLSPLTA